MTSNAISVDVVLALAGGAIGTPGIDLFAMEWGEGTDSQVLVIDTGGLTSDVRDTYEQPTFQILIRGARGGDANEVYQTARDVHTFLIQAPATADRLQFEPTAGPPQLLGRDENDRMIFSGNYFTYRDPL